MSASHVCPHCGSTIHHGLPVVRQVVRDVAKEYGVTMTAVLGRYGTKTIRAARKESWRRLRQNGISNCEIARQFDRDPSTIQCGINRRR